MKPGKSKHRKKDTKRRKEKEETSKSSISPVFAKKNNGTFSNGPQQQLPLPFPSHWKRPRKNDFLRDEPPLRESYQAALKTSYLGLAVDPPAAQQGDDDCPLTATLEELQKRHYFQTDITQPFGLGTKCAKTYVTRCLVGDPGTTYKYLGLRMFAYSWQKKPTENVCRAVGDFKDQFLVPRTRHHLQRLQQQRTYHYNADRSRPCYNICLINRMDSGRDDYKVEPTLDEDHTRIAVAWHADSSLEHYSNIAVYQAILGHDRGDWSLAVRTTPNAEGPSIASDTQPDPGVPPLSIRLPSRSTYYMLDDFNHHHQHAVLKTNHTNNHTASNAKTIRYSATYRLLRPSHTVQELLEQCRNTSRGFHKKGLKPWRSEQVLLTHVEGEWLRQFYVQGSHHKGMLWEDWEGFLTELWKHWGSLEARTRFVVDLLVNAARGKCSAGTDAPPPPTGKAERKRRDKQRKALAQIQDVLARDNNNSNTNNARATLYRPMASLLRERAKLRNQWKKREKDFVFATLDPKHRPLPWPVRYQTTADAKWDGIMATSPLPEDLGVLADQLEACGKAFETGKATDLPAFVVLPGDKASAKVAPVPQSTATNGDKQTTNHPSTTANPSSSNGTQAVGNHQNGSKSKKKKKRKHQSNKQTSLDGGTKKKKKKRY